MARTIRKILACALLLALLVQSVSAKGQGACVKQPDPEAPTEGDKYYMRIANGEYIAQENGERHRGDYFYKAIRSCRPRHYRATYDRFGNAHLEFVIKDRKRSGLPLRGSNRNNCDLAERFSEYTDGAYTPECRWGDVTEIAKDWAKAKAGPSDEDEAKYPFEQ